MSRLLNRLPFLVLVGLLVAGPVLAAPSLSPVETAISAPGDGPADPLSPFVNLIGVPAAMGAIRVKDTNAIAKKFVARAQQAAPDYAEGVKSAGADWEAGAAAGEENYKQAVTEAASQGRFGKGVRAAGSAKYVQHASTKGAQRFGPGVAAAEGEFAKGVGPVLETIRGLNLTPRGVKGSPQNQARANQVASALREMKLKR